MAGYGIKDRRLAVRLKQLAQNPDGQVGDEGLRVSDVFVFKAPAGGIASRSGTTLGSATCDAYYISAAGVLTVLQDAGSTTITATVYNMSTAAVAANAYIQAVRINNLYVANWEDCG